MLGLYNCTNVRTELRYAPFPAVLARLAMPRQVRSNDPVMRREGPEFAIPEVPVRETAVDEN
jgi:hypothetical protein